VQSIVKGMDAFDLKDSSLPEGRSSSLPPGRNGRQGIIPVAFKLNIT